MVARHDILTLTVAVSEYTDLTAPSAFGVVLSTPYQEKLNLDA